MEKGSVVTVCFFTLIKKKSLKNFMPFIALCSTKYFGVNTVLLISHKFVYMYTNYTEL